MTQATKRTPTGAAVLQPGVTEAIAAAVLDEMAEVGYGRLSMDAVARRAGVGKSALYRRWPSKQDMVLTVLGDFSVALAEVHDTGSLHGDVVAALEAMRGWLTHPQFSRFFPDLIAEAGRNPALAEAVAATIGEPRRRVLGGVLRRAVERGELPADLDVELALDVIGAPLYWRLVVRHTDIDPGYVDRLTTVLLRGLGAVTPA
ncbi:TetR/AcrR family transcriptional regulator [Geodermatophilus sp. SYSU D01119]